ncbi:unnamed protein product [Caenorhabditis brenneri]
MIECNIRRCAKVLLIFQLLLVIVEAQNAVTPAGSPSKNATSEFTIVFDKKIIEYTTVFRFNILIVGGIFNMTFSLINLILGVLNFYFIFGRYDSRLRQVAAKLKIAVDEMSSRDLHPKIKMSLSRVIPPNNVALHEIMKLFKEPSELFDHSNGLLADQKEARLRKLTMKNDKEENTNTVKSPATKSKNQKSTVSDVKSAPTEAKKTK